VSTNVTLNGATVQITGTPGSLSIMEDTFIGPEGLTINSAQDIVSFAQAMSTEINKAWPGLITVTINQTEGK
jgi:hypothetical protein